MSGILWTWRYDVLSEAHPCAKCSAPLPVGAAVLVRYELGRRHGDGLGPSPEILLCRGCADAPVRR